MKKFKVGDKIKYNDCVLICCGEVDKQGVAEHVKSDLGGYRNANVPAEYKSRGTNRYWFCK